MPFVDSNHAQIHYSLEGSPEKPTLIFSNSLGANLTMWDPQVSDFTKSFRILRYDTRGHGKSSVTPGPYTLEQLGKDVLALADSLKIDRFYFCGLSMGGQTGMWLALNAPARLHKIVLCNTGAKIGSADSWNTRIAAVKSSGMRVLAPSVVERWLTARFRSSDPASAAKTQSMVESTNPDGYIANCSAIRDFDCRDRLGQITTPTLVIAGARDPATPPADGQFLANHIPGARYAELDAAHLSNIEAAADFNRAALVFLASS